MPGGKEQFFNEEAACVSSFWKSAHVFNLDECPLPGWRNHPVCNCPQHLDLCFTKHVPDSELGEACTNHLRTQRGWQLANNRSDE